MIFCAVSGVSDLSNTDCMYLQWTGRAVKIKSKLASFQAYCLPCFSILQVMIKAWEYKPGNKAAASLLHIKINM